jgi:UDP-GlcNAc:undecaprenyl-phosphate GlcNAc-1-phosphate transferase
MIAVIFAGTLLISVLIAPAIIRLADRYDLYDHPDDDRRVHRSPVPRIGGIAVFGATALGLLFVFLPESLWHEWMPEQRRFFGGVLLGGAVVFVAGLWDDLRGLTPAAKLTAQLVAALIVFQLGFRIETLSVGESGMWHLGIFALPLTLLWIAGVTNAFNLIDGMDGLATGIAIVALATTLVVAGVLGNLEVVVVCSALLGALIGFLRYNFNPARIFLGDSGSLFVGFMLAVLSVHGSLKSATAVLAIVPLFALGIPLLDTSLAIGRRWLRGIPLSGADARHVHHRLLALGLTQRAAAVVLYVSATALAVLGVSLAFAPPALLFWVAVAGGGATLVLFLIGMQRLQYHEFGAAGVVLVSGVIRLRRLIQDQIHARDVAHIIERAGTLAEINTVLEDNASSFDFLRMEVCRESVPAGKHLALLNGESARAWKLDFLVTPRTAPALDPYVLRVWCGDTGRSRRPFGAERVARALGPAIEERLAMIGVRHGGTAVVGESILPSFADGLAAADEMRSRRPAKPKLAPAGESFADDGTLQHAVR